MIRGFVAGSFDIIHPGYIKLFKEAKEHCDWLIVGLHDDPSIERPQKLRPILTLSEREEILSSIVYIDEIITYNTESELTDILNKVKPTIRFLGDDYKGKGSTRGHLKIPIHYVDRSHGWSTTKLKNLIRDELNLDV